MTAYDYLVIGTGASAMAFVDTVLTETDATVLMVDRRAVPGGHWNDAYPFVRLHQPAAFYGVASKELSRGVVETSGLNAGFMELSTGVAITAYYHELMDEVFLPSGRVTYLPLTDHLGDGELEARLSGDRRRVEYGTLVDATFLTTSIPSTQRPNFEVADRVECVPPNRLPHLAAAGRHVAVLGGGKTGIDAITWLLSNGHPADALTWVVPRDSWFWNRAAFQPSMEFFDPTIGGQATQFELMATAATVDDVCREMEACGRWLRLDDEVWPTMFHAAILSEEELATVRRVADVVRGQRVRRIEPGVLTLDGGTRDLPADTLYVDCTASAVAGNVNDRTPVFEPGRINLQMIRQFQPCFSSALIAFIEANVADDAVRQEMTRPTPMTDTVEDYLRGAADGMRNQAAWSVVPEVSAWLGEVRLDGFSALVARALAEAETHPERLEVLGRTLEAAPAAMANLDRLVAG